MSSDGSVSSRISQFGLYRTIDARTEEFLKLSKKRQIRQGCVCAAISTALTVTIVVTFLLIYEYNVIAEARKSSHKSTWLDLMNNSADDPNLIEILNKEKIDIDKPTLKLLPILLKALNQNGYIEKIIEEPTTVYTPFVKEVTTETSITKNIFADTRNWMKTPHSRLYTVEYKTSPIVYFKNPTRNVEYFTKIRKIRDYQRILNYVDKMISDKSSLGTTQPMRKDYGYTEKPYKMTTPIRKQKLTQKDITKQKTHLETKVEEKKTNCKCHKLNELMNKLLSNIQQLLLYFSGHNSTELNPCNISRPVQTKPLNSVTRAPINKNIHKVATENYNIFESKFSRTPSYTTFLNRHKYTIDTPIKKKNFDIRRDHTVNAIMNLIKPSFNKHNEVYFESDEAFSTTNTYLKSLNTKGILKESSSKSYAKPLNNVNTKATSDTVTTVADYILQKGIYDGSLDMRSLPETDYSDDDDYAETTETTTYLRKNVNKLDTYNLKLPKKKPMEAEKTSPNEDKKYPFKGARPSKKIFNNIRLMRKMGNLVPTQKENVLFFPNERRLPPTIKQSTTPYVTLITSKSNYKTNITYTIKATEKPTIVPNITKTKNTKPTDKNPKRNHTHSITSEEQTQKMLDENISKETTLNHIEEEIMILNNETTSIPVEHNNTTPADTYQWEMVQLEENATSTKSMIPLGRSTYLEMQRNDWKRDEIHDFDNEINYIFD